MIKQGRVVKIYGPVITVEVEENRYECSYRQKLEKQIKGQANVIAVGDLVLVAVQSEKIAVIEEICPRKNKLSRMAAGRKKTQEHLLVANIDQVICVLAYQEPEPNSFFLDRLLVAAEFSEIQPVIFLNKCDLGRKSFAEKLETYREIGYLAYEGSAVTGVGLEILQKRLKDRVSAIVGPSGVGKTSLLRAIIPGFTSRVGEISRKTKKGAHITTHAELVELPFGGFVADTPGLREFGVWELEPLELGQFFPEIQELEDMCKYANCTHSHEPGCVVKESEKRITPWRYESYLKILESL